MVKLIDYSYLDEELRRWQEKQEKVKREQKATDIAAAKAKFEADQQAKWIKERPLSMKIADILRPV
jgi:hypothetical protein